MVYGLAHVAAIARWSPQASHYAGPTRLQSDSSPFVSIVIPVRNEGRTIDDCLSAMIRQTMSSDRFEILVIDGQSTDDTADKIRAWSSTDPRIRLLENPNRTAPAALNLGIRAARGEVIARMDGHAVAPPDYLERCLADLQATGCWCAGGSMVRVGTTSVSRAIAAATMSPFGVGDAVHNYAQEPRWVETVFLGMWPRWVFLRVGLFDEELVRNQDDELSFRIREAGGGIWMNPAVAIRYEPRPSLSKLFSQYRQYAMWKVRVFQMHPRALRPRHLIPAAWVGSIAGGLIVAPLTVLGPVAALASTAAYAAVMLTASYRIDAKGTTRPLVMTALVTLHLAYGIGFWLGLVRFAPRWIWNRRGRPAQLVQAIDA
jgi:succinoglycan biosynthesis protein ExoA